MHPKSGPLLIMAIRMLDDLWQFLMLAAFVIIAFTAAFYVLFNGAAALAALDGEEVRPLLFCVWGSCPASGPPLARLWPTSGRPLAPSAAAPHRGTAAMRSAVVSLVALSIRLLALIAVGLIAVGLTRWGLRGGAYAVARARDLRRYGRCTTAPPSSPSSPSSRGSPRGRWTASRIASFSRLIR